MLESEMYLVASTEYGLYLSKKSPTWNEGILCPDQKKRTYCGEWCPFFHASDSTRDDYLWIKLTCRPISASFQISKDHYVEEM